MGKTFMIKQSILIKTKWRSYKTNNRTRLSDTTGCLLDCLLLLSTRQTLKIRNTNIKISKAWIHKVIQ